MANCGQVRLQPGAFNVVPALVEMALEFRHGTEARLDEMEAALLGLAANTLMHTVLALAQAS